MQIQKKQSLINKITSVVVAVNFLWSAIPPGIVGATTSSAPISFTDSRDIASLVNMGINVPENYADINSCFKGEDDKLVIHVQDAHCNYEAQKNYADMLKHIIKTAGEKKRNLKLVALEGAYGNIDVLKYAAIPNVKLKTRLSDYFLRKGYLTGAEYFAIVSGLPIILKGVDNKELYIRNVELFKNNHAFREKSLLELKKIDTAFKSLVKQMLPEKLYNLTMKKDMYERQQISFTDYAKFMVELSRSESLDIASYPNMSKVVQAMAIEERISFSKIEEERQLLLSRLETVLAKEDIASLVSKTLYFKVGRISPMEYYVYLDNLMKSFQVDLYPYPNLNNYISVVRIYSDIDKDKVFKETDVLQEYLQDNLYEDSDQIVLIRMLNRIRILEKLFKLELTRKELKYYHNHKRRFKVKYFKEFLARIQERFSVELDNVNINAEVLDTKLPSLEEFYDVALKRDQLLVNNTVFNMIDNGIDTALLVTGGFHTEGVTNYFENKGISYISVSPKISNNENNPYLNVMMETYSPLEESLIGSRNRLMPAIISAGNPFNQVKGFLFENEFLIAETAIFIKNFLNDSLSSYIGKQAISESLDLRDKLSDLAEIYVASYRSRYKSILEERGYDKVEIDRRLKELDSLENAMNSAIATMKVDTLNNKFDLQIAVKDLQGNDKQVRLVDSIAGGLEGARADSFIDGSQVTVSDYAYSVRNDILDKQSTDVDKKVAKSLKNIAVLRDVDSKDMVSDIIRTIHADNALYAFISDLSHSEKVEIFSELFIQSSLGIASNLTSAQVKDQMIEDITASMKIVVGRNNKFKKLMDNNSVLGEIFQDYSPTNVLTTIRMTDYFFDQLVSKTNLKVDGFDAQDAISLLTTENIESVMDFAADSNSALGNLFEFVLDVADLNEMSVDEKIGAKTIAQYFTDRQQQEQEMASKAEVSDILNGFLSVSKEDRVVMEKLTESREKFENLLDIEEVLLNEIKVLRLLNDKQESLDMLLGREQYADESIQQFIKDQAVSESDLAQAFEAEFLYPVFQDIADNKVGLEESLLKRINYSMVNGGGRTKTRAPMMQIRWSNNASETIKISQTKVESMIRRRLSEKIKKELGDIAEINAFVLGNVLTADNLQANENQLLKDVVNYFLLQPDVDWNQMGDLVSLLAQKGVAKKDVLLTIKEHAVRIENISSEHKANMQQLKLDTIFKFGGDIQILNKIKANTSSKSMLSLEIDGEFLMVDYDTAEKFAANKINQQFEREIAPTLAGFTGTITDIFNSMEDWREKSKFISLLSLSVFNVGLITGGVMDLINQTSLKGKAKRLAAIKQQLKEQMKDLPAEMLEEENLEKLITVFQNIQGLEALTADAKIEDILTEIAKTVKDEKAGDLEFAYQGIRSESSGLKNRSGEVVGLAMNEDGRVNIEQLEKDVEFSETTVALEGMEGVSFKFDKQFESLFLKQKGNLSLEQYAKNFFQNVIDKRSIDVSALKGADNAIRMCMLENSYAIAENHIEDGFVGFNKNFVDNNIALTVYLGHELEHETGVSGMQSEERYMFYKDMQATVSLLKEKAAESGASLAIETEKYIQSLMASGMQEDATAIQVLKNSQKLQDEKSIREGFGLDNETVLNLENFDSENIEAKFLLSKIFSDLDKYSASREQAQEMALEQINQEADMTKKQSMFAALGSELNGFISETETNVAYKMTLADGTVKELNGVTLMGENLRSVFGEGLNIVSNQAEISKIREFGSIVNGNPNMLLVDGKINVLLANDVSSLRRQEAATDETGTAFADTAVLEYQQKFEQITQWDQPLAKKVEGTFRMFRMIDSKDITLEEQARITEAEASRQIAAKHKEIYQSLLEKNGIKALSDFAGFRYGLEIGKVEAGDLRSPNVILNGVRFADLNNTQRSQLTRAQKYIRSIVKAGNIVTPKIEKAESISGLDNIVVYDAEKGEVKVKISALDYITDKEPDTEEQVEEETKELDKKASTIGNIIARSFFEFADKGMTNKNGVKIPGIYAFSDSRRQVLNERDGMYLHTSVGGARLNLSEKQIADLINKLDAIGKDSSLNTEREVFAAKANFLAAKMPGFANRPQAEKIQMIKDFTSELNMIVNRGLSMLDTAKTAKTAFADTTTLEYRNSFQEIQQWNKPIEQKLEGTFRMFRMINLNEISLASADNLSTKEKEAKIAERNQILYDSIAKHGGIDALSDFAGFRYGLETGKIHVSDLRSEKVMLNGVRFSDFSDNERHLLDSAQSYIRSLVKAGGIMTPAIENLEDARKLDNIVIYDAKTSEIEIEIGGLDFIGKKREDRETTEEDQQDKLEELNEKSTHMGNEIVNSFFKFANQGMTNKSGGKIPGIYNYHDKKRDVVRTPEGLRLDIKVGSTDLKLTEEILANLINQMDAIGKDGSVNTEQAMLALKANFLANRIKGFVAKTQADKIQAINDFSRELNMVINRGLAMMDTVGVSKTAYADTTRLADWNIENRSTDKKLTDIKLKKNIEKKVKALLLNNTTASAREMATARQKIVDEEIKAVNKAAATTSMAVSIFKKAADKEIKGKNFVKMLNDVNPGLNVKESDLTGDIAFEYIAAGNSKATVKITVSTTSGPVEVAMAVGLINSQEYNFDVQSYQNGVRVPAQGIKLDGASFKEFIEGDTLENVLKDAINSKDKKSVTKAVNQIKLAMDVIADFYARMGEVPFDLNAGNFITALNKKTGKQESVMIDTGDGMHLTDAEQIAATFRLYVLDPAKEILNPEQAENFLRQRMEKRVLDVVDSYIEAGVAESVKLNETTLSELGKLGLDMERFNELFDAGELDVILQKDKKKIQSGVYNGERIAVVDSKEAFIGQSNLTASEKSQKNETIYKEVKQAMRGVTAYADTTSLKKKASGFFNLFGSKADKSIDITQQDLLNSKNVSTRVGGTTGSFTADVKGSKYLVKMPDSDWAIKAGFAENVLNNLFDVTTPKGKSIVFDGSKIDEASSSFQEAVHTAKRNFERMQKFNNDGTLKAGMDVRSREKAEIMNDVKANGEEIIYVQDFLDNVVDAESNYRNSVEKDAKVVKLKLTEKNLKHLARIVAADIVLDHQDFLQAKTYDNIMVSKDGKNLYKIDTDRIYSAADSAYMKENMAETVDEVLNGDTVKQIEEFLEDTALVDKGFTFDVKDKMIVQNALMDALNDFASQDISSLELVGADMNQAYGDVALATGNQASAEIASLTNSLKTAQEIIKDKLTFSTPSLAMAEGWGALKGDFAAAVAKKGDDFGVEAISDYVKQTGNHYKLGVQVDDSMSSVDKRQQVDFVVDTSFDRGDLALNPAEMNAVLKIASEKTIAQHNRIFSPSTLEATGNERSFVLVALDKSPFMGMNELADGFIGVNIGAIDHAVKAKYPEDLAKAKAAKRVILETLLLHEMGHEALGEVSQEKELELIEADFANLAAISEQYKKFGFSRDELMDLVASVTELDGSLLAKAKAKFELTTQRNEARDERLENWLATLENVDKEYDFAGVELDNPYINFIKGINDWDQFRAWLKNGQISEVLKNNIDQAREQFVTKLINQAKDNAMSKLKEKGLLKAGEEDYSFEHSVVGTVSPINSDYDLTVNGPRSEFVISEFMKLVKSDDVLGAEGNLANMLDSNVYTDPVMVHNYGDYRKAAMHTETRMAFFSTLMSVGSKESKLWSDFKNNIRNVQDIRFANIQTDESVSAEEKLNQLIEEAEDLFDRRNAMIAKLRKVELGDKDYDSLSKSGRARLDNKVREKLLAKSLEQLADLKSTYGVGINTSWDDLTERQRLALNNMSMEVKSFEDDAYFTPGTIQDVVVHQQKNKLDLLKLLEKIKEENLSPAEERMKKNALLSSHMANLVGIDNSSFVDFNEAKMSHRFQNSYLENYGKYQAKIDAKVRKDPIAALAGSAKYIARMSYIAMKFFGSSDMMMGQQELNLDFIVRIMSIKDNKANTAEIEKELIKHAQENGWTSEIKLQDYNAIAQRIITDFSELADKLNIDIIRAVSADINMANATEDFNMEQQKQFLEEKRKKDDTTEAFSEGWGELDKQFFAEKSTKVVDGKELTARDEIVNYLEESGNYFENTFEVGKEQIDVRFDGDCKDLGLTEEQLGNILQSVLSKTKEKYKKVLSKKSLSFTKNKSKLTIASINKSPYFGMNHVADGFMAVNIDAINAATADLEAEEALALKQVMLEALILHEMGHEAQGKGMEIEEQLLFSDAEHLTELAKNTNISTDKLFSSLAKVTQENTELIEAVRSHQAIESGDTTVQKMFGTETKQAYKSLAGRLKTAKRLSESQYNSFSENVASLISEQHQEELTSALSQYMDGNVASEAVAEAVKLLSQPNNIRVLDMKHDSHNQDPYSLVRQDGKFCISSAIMKQGKVFTTLFGLTKKNQAKIIAESALYHALREAGLPHKMAFHLQGYMSSAKYQPGKLSSLDKFIINKSVTDHHSHDYLSDVMKDSNYKSLKGVDKYYKQLEVVSASDTERIAKFESAHAKSVRNRIKAIGMAWNFGRLAVMLTAFYFIHHGGEHLIEHLGHVFHVGETIIGYVVVGFALAIKLWDINDVREFLMYIDKIHFGAFFTKPLTKAYNATIGKIHVKAAWNSVKNSIAESVSNGARNAKTSISKFASRTSEGLSQVTDKVLSPKWAIVGAMILGLMLTAPVSTPASTAKIQDGETIYVAATTSTDNLLQSYSDETMLLDDATLDMADYYELSLTPEFLDSISFKAAFDMLDKDAKDLFINKYFVRIPEDSVLALQDDLNTWQAEYLKNIFLQISRVNSDKQKAFIDNLNPYGTSFKQVFLNKKYKCQNLLDLAKNLSHLEFGDDDTIKPVGGSEFWEVILKNSMARFDVYDLKNMKQHFLRNIVNDKSSASLFNNLSLKELSEIKLKAIVPLLEKMSRNNEHIYFSNKVVQMIAAWEGNPEALTGALVYIWNDLYTYRKADTFFEGVYIDKKETVIDYYRSVDEIAGNGELEKSFQSTLSIFRQLSKNKLIDAEDTDRLLQPFLKNGNTVEAYGAWTKKALVPYLAARLDKWDASNLPDGKESWKDADWQDVLTRAMLGVRFQDKLYVPISAETNKVNDILESQNIDRDSVADFSMGLNFANLLRLFPQDILAEIPSDFISRHRMDHKKITAWSNAFFRGTNTEVGSKQAEEYKDSIDQDLGFHTGGSLFSLASEIGHLKHFLSAKKYGLQWEDVRDAQNVEVFDRAFATAAQMRMPYLVFDDGQEYARGIYALGIDVLVDKTTRENALESLKPIVSSERWAEILDIFKSTDYDFSTIYNMNKEKQLLPSELFYIGQLYLNNKDFTSANKVQILEKQKRLVELGISEDAFADEFFNVSGIMAVSQTGSSKLQVLPTTDLWAHEEAGVEKHISAERLYLDIHLHMVEMFGRNNVPAHVQPYLIPKMMDYMTEQNSQENQDDYRSMIDQLWSIDSNMIKSWLQELKEEGLLKEGDSIDKTKRKSIEEIYSNQDAPAQQASISWILMLLILGSMAKKSKAQQIAEQIPDDMSLEDIELAKEIISKKELVRDDSQSADKLPEAYWLNNAELRLKFMESFTNAENYTDEATFTKYMTYLHMIAASGKKAADQWEPGKRVAKAEQKEQRESFSMLRKKLTSRRKKQADKMKRKRELKSLSPEEKEKQRAERKKARELAAEKEWNPSLEIPNSLKRTYYHEIDGGELADRLYRDQEGRIDQELIAIGVEDGRGDSQPVNYNHVEQLLQDLDLPSKFLGKTGPAAQIEQVLQLDLVSEKARPRNTANDHLYPASMYMHEYMEVCRKLMSEIKDMKPRETQKAQVIEKLAVFYQYAINSHIFDNINNSMLMNMVNGILKMHGINPIAHTILDHAAHRVDPVYFNKIFIAEILKENEDLTKELEPAEELDIDLEELVKWQNNLLSGEAKLDHTNRNSKRILNLHTDIYNRFSENGIAPQLVLEKIKNLIYDTKRKGKLMEDKLDFACVAMPLAVWNKKGYEYSNNNWQKLLEMFKDKIKDKYGDDVKGVEMVTDEDGNTKMQEVDLAGEYVGKYQTRVLVTGLNQQEIKEVTDSFLSEFPADERNWSLYAGHSAIDLADLTTYEDAGQADRFDKAIEDKINSELQEIVARSEIAEKNIEFLLRKAGLDAGPTNIVGEDFLNQIRSELDDPMVLELNSVIRDARRKYIPLAEYETGKIPRVSHKTGELDFFLDNYVFGNEDGKAHKHFPAVNAGDKKMLILYLVNLNEVLLNSLSDLRFNDSINKSVFDKVIAMKEGMLAKQLKLLESLRADAAEEMKSLKSGDRLYGLMEMSIRKIDKIISDYAEPVEITKMGDEIWVYLRNEEGKHIQVFLELDKFNAMNAAFPADSRDSLYHSLLADILAQAKTYAHNKLGDSDIACFSEEDAMKFINDVPGILSGHVWDVPESSFYKDGFSPLSEGLREMLTVSTTGENVNINVDPAPTMRELQPGMKISMGEMVYHYNEKVNIKDVGGKRLAMYQLKTSTGDNIPFVSYDGRFYHASKKDLEGYNIEVTDKVAKEQLFINHTGVADAGVSVVTGTTGVTVTYDLESTSTLDGLGDINTFQKVNQEFLNNRIMSAQDLKAGRSVFDVAEKAGGNVKQTARVIWDTVKDFNAQLEIINNVEDSNAALAALARIKEIGEKIDAMDVEFSEQEYISRGELNQVFLNIVRGAESKKYQSTANADYLAVLFDKGMKQTQAEALLELERKKGDVLDLTEEQNVLISNIMDAITAKAWDKEEDTLIDAPAAVADRHIVIGDVHGDLKGFMTELYAAGLIDNNANWIGGTQKLVQVGDLIDRGIYSNETVKYLKRLQQQARNAGGDVIRLLGNHEMMLWTGLLGDTTTFGDWVFSGGLNFIEYACKTDEQKAKLESLQGNFQQMMLEIADEKAIAETFEFLDSLDAFRELKEILLADIASGDIQAAYVKGGRMYSHSGLNKKTYEKLAEFVKDNADDFTGIAEGAFEVSGLKDVKNLEGLASMMNQILTNVGQDTAYMEKVKGFIHHESPTNIFMAPVSDDLGIFQVIGHTPDIEEGKIKQAKNNMVLNVDIGLGYAFHRGYMEVNNRETKGVKLIDGIRAKSAELGIDYNKIFRNKKKIDAVLFEADAQVLPEEYSKAVKDALGSIHKKLVEVMDARYGLKKEQVNMIISGDFMKGIANKDNSYIDMSVVVDTKDLTKAQIKEIDDYIGEFYNLIQSSFKIPVRSQLSEYYASLHLNADMSEKKGYVYEDNIIKQEYFDNTVKFVEQSPNENTNMALMQKLMWSEIVGNKEQAFRFKKQVNKIVADDKQSNKRFEQSAMKKLRSMELLNKRSYSDETSYLKYRTVVERSFEAIASAYMLEEGFWYTDRQETLFSVIASVDKIMSSRDEIKEGSLRQAFINLLAKRDKMEDLDLAKDKDFLLVAGIAESILLKNQIKKAAVAKDASVYETFWNALSVTTVGPEYGIYLNQASLNAFMDKYDVTVEEGETVLDVVSRMEQSLSSNEDRKEFYGVLFESLVRSNTLSSDIVNKILDIVLSDMSETYRNAVKQDVSKAILQARKKEEKAEGIRAINELANSVDFVKVFSALSRSDLNQIADMINDESIFEAKQNKDFITFMKTVDMFNALKDGKTAKISEILLTNNIASFDIQNLIKWFTMNSSDVNGEMTASIDGFADLYSVSSTDKDFLLGYFTDINKVASDKALTASENRLLSAFSMYMNIYGRFNGIRAASMFNRDSMRSFIKEFDFAAADNLSGLLSLFLTKQNQVEPAYIYDSFKEIMLVSPTTETYSDNQMSKPRGIIKAA